MNTALSIYIFNKWFAIDNAPSLIFDHDIIVADGFDALKYNLKVSDGFTFKL